jgi:glycosyltransferase involved in cell wall biosynthesis
MVGISAYTIVRNEEILIAKHLAELTRHARDVLCVVQPSTDATLLFAEHAAAQLAEVGLRCRVIEHVPARLGKEFSVRFALEQCAFDWCLNLDADETYVGRPVQDVVEALPAQATALSMAHLQAIACTEGAWFKIEPLQPKVRIIDRRRFDTDVDYELHAGLDALRRDQAIAHLPDSQGRIVEYKAAWQHYVDQLFYESQGSPMHEADACRARMAPRALELGEAVFRIDRRGRQASRGRDVRRT